ncbi:FCGBP protein, partial [Bucco capensis]|nr:FCGBP protein [Bucco capensis]
IRTPFGLRLSFDWYSYARLILPSPYSGAVCGLCGNANGDPADDFLTRDGHQASSEVELGSSWKVGDVPGCSSGCVGDCPRCSEEMKELYRGDGYCGLLQKRTGPFRACHGVLDVQGFLEDCVFDACHTKGHKEIFCKALGAYSSQCQSHGISLEPWRNQSFCALSCPPHSHYELCGTSCPSTCLDLDDLQACSSSPCTEGCFCDQGYVLSGELCVPLAECGCVATDGHYYKKGEEFYLPSCHQRCVCKAKGLLECHEVFCSPQEECRVEDGLLGCYPVSYGRLVVSGDPHYLTFDGRAFDLSASCTYVLAKLCKAQGSLSNFTVLLEHDLGGRSKVALMKKVVMFLEGYVVSVERGSKWEVNQELFTLPFVSMDKKLRVGQEGNNIVLQSSSGLQLLYNSASYLLLTIPAIYRGHVCGLGGNYNGDPADDFQLPGGTLAKSTQEFVTSWKIQGEDDSCSDGCEEKLCPTCDVLDAVAYRANSSCGLILDSRGPFGSCHLRVSPVEYFKHCVQDVCVAQGDQEVLCHSLQVYVTACQAAGAHVASWRTPSFCPLSCPPGSHYELCTRTCDFSCSSLSVPAPCSWRCFEGCQCEDGFLFDGGSCVSLEQCGC